MRIGSSPRLATELYLPLSNVRRYFVAPHGEIEAHNVAQLVDNEQIGEYRVRSGSYGLDVGRELGKFGEIRGGVMRSSGSARIIVGDVGTPRSEFDVRGYFLRFSYDHLDSALFPRAGQALTLEWRGEDNIGSTVGSDLMTADWRGAWSRGKYTGIAWLSGGTTVSGSETNVRAWFPLGGFLNLSGVRADSLAGPYYGIARVIGLRSIGRGGEGVLNVPAYAGLSFEIGNAWSSRRDIDLGSTRRDVALFLGADTYIGPVYIAAGYDDQGHSGFYCSSAAASDPCGYRPRLAARFSIFWNTSVGLSPAREYSCRRLISAIAASRSAAVVYQWVRCQSAPSSFWKGSELRRLIRRP